MSKGSPDDHERAAAGLDFEEDPLRNGASSLGAKIAEDGPEAIFDAIEELLPDSWREQIKAYPVAAVAIGVGVGIWLGMKKSDEIIAAGTALISSAAMSNVSQVMDKMKGDA